MFISILSVARKRSYHGYPPLFAAGLILASSLSFASPPASAEIFDFSAPSVSGVGTFPFDCKVPMFGSGTCGTYTVPAGKSMFVYLRDSGNDDVTFIAVTKDTGKEISNTGWMGQGKSTKLMSAGNRAIDVKLLADARDLREKMIYGSATIK